MKAYVDELVPELIAQERVRELEQRLAGLHHVLRDYNRTSYGTPQKGEWFTNLLALLDQAEPFFFDERNPEKTLTYFVPLGTLRLLALQEQYLYYSRIYDRADPDRGKHLEDLRTAIATYSAALTQAKAAAVNWRVQMKTGIDTRTQQTVGVLGPTTTTTWTAIDRLCSWQVSYQHNSLGGGDLYGEEHAKRDLEQRRQQVTFAYTANLELLLAPAELWQYMDPTNQMAIAQADSRLRYLRALRLFRQRATLRRQFAGSADHACRGVRWLARRRPRSILWRPLRRTARPERWKYLCARHATGRSDRVCSRPRR